MRSDLAQETERIGLVAPLRCARAPVSGLARPMPAPSSSRLASHVRVAQITRKSGSSKPSPPSPCLASLQRLEQQRETLVTRPQRA